MAFDSDRKRMSLIVKCRGEYILMTKGADSIILPRIDMSLETTTQDQSLNSDPKKSGDGSFNHERKKNRINR